MPTLPTSQTLNAAQSAETSRKASKVPNDGASKSNLSTVVDGLPSELLEKMSPVTGYAAKSTLVPALMNTPITTSLARPLVQSQYSGLHPDVRQIMSARGWVPALGRTGIRYAIADTAREVSGKAVRALVDLHKKDEAPLTDADRVKMNFVVDAGASALMTGASQPLTALQVYRQVQQGKTQADTSRFVQGLMSHPFRGSAGNFLSTFIMFNLDRNDRSLIARRDAGEISGTQVALRQIGLGGLAGVTSNFLKTHANARALGLSHQDILKKVAKTAQKQPAVFAAQVAYAWILGGVSNKLWASSISVLKDLDVSVQRAVLASEPTDDSSDDKNQMQKGPAQEA